MKYAFIDYENLNSLDGLALDEYDRIFLFIGASSNQYSIRLTDKFNDEINITLITVKEIAKNNVDFHIAYYLGKLDNSVDKEIEFYLFSKDQGYDALCRFIEDRNNGRICKRIGLALTESVDSILKIDNTAESEKEKINRAFEQYRAFIKERNRKNLPAKLTALQNDIHNRTVFKGLDKNKEINNITKVINKLINEKLIEVTNGKISYL